MNGTRHSTRRTILRCGPGAHVGTPPGRRCCWLHHRTRRAWPPATTPPSVDPIDVISDPTPSARSRQPLISLGILDSDELRRTSQARPLVRAHLSQNRNRGASGPGRISLRSTVGQESSGPNRWRCPQRRVRPEGSARTRRPMPTPHPRSTPSRPFRCRRTARRPQAPGSRRADGRPGQSHNRGDGGAAAGGHRRGHLALSGRPERRVMASPAAWDCWYRASSSMVVSR